MKHTLLAVLTMLALAGCGADGEPVQPTLDATVGIGNSGVHSYGALGLHQGPVSVYLGF